MLTSAEDNIVLSRSLRISCTTSHKTCHKLYDKRHPLQGAFWARSMGSARQTGHTPHSRTSRSFIQKARGHYCFISLTQDTMHYFTQNMPTTPLQQETSHIRMPLDARSMGSARQTGHTPHGRTSGTPSPQRMKILTKITVRQSCSRERRTILFYLTYLE